jgi:hypothetical protein
MVLLPTPLRDATPRGRFVARTRVHRKARRIIITGVDAGGSATHRHVVGCGRVEIIQLWVNGAGEGIPPA